MAELYKRITEVNFVATASVNSKQTHNFHELLNLFEKPLLLVQIK